MAKRKIEHVYRKSLGMVPADMLLIIVVIGVVLFVAMYRMNDRRIQGIWTLKNVILAILLILIGMLFRVIFRSIE